MRRFFILLLLTFCCKQVEENDVIKIGIRGTLRTTDPHCSSLFAVNQVLYNIYEALVEFDKRMRLLPCLAYKWKQKHPCCWRFYIRKGVKFHCGDILTAWDVRKSIMRAKTLKGSQVKELVRLIKDVKVIDSFTVDIITEKPAPMLLQYLRAIRIIKEKNGKLYGTGPYMLSAMEGDSVVILQRFEDYWGKKPFFKKVIFVSGRSSGDLLNKFRRKKIDIARISGRFTKEAGKIKEAYLKRGSAITIGYIVANFKIPVLCKKEVRKAISYAIDRHELSEKIYKGLAVSANQLALPGIAGYNPRLPEIKYMPDSAKILLKKAGIDTLKITLMAAKGLTRWLDILKGQMGRANIKLKLDYADFNEFWEKLGKRDYELAYVGWAFTIPDVWDFLARNCHTPEGNYGTLNDGGYSNRELDKLIEESEVEIDPLKRLRILQDCMRILREESPVIPLLSFPPLYIVRKGIKWEPRQDMYIFAYEIKR